MVYIKIFLYIYHVVMLCFLMMKALRLLWFEQTLSELRLFNGLSKSVSTVIIARRLRYVNIQLSIYVVDPHSSDPQSHAINIHELWYIELVVWIKLVCHSHDYLNRTWSSNAYIAFALTQLFWQLILRIVT